MHLTVVQAPAEHSGLGTGTQLGLAVGRALALASGLPDPDITELARRVGRGRRSAIGVHGFAQGGFLVEGGKRTPQTLAPLLVRLPFPEMWRVLLILVGSSTGWHGDREQAAFRHLLNRPAALASTDTLCRLVLLGLLPALREQDLEEFGEALHDFNARAGETFAAVQGGTYASPGISDMISFIRRQGVRCVGQSSWGPAVFAVVSDEASAENLARRIRNHLGPGSGEVLITRACNEGATVVVTP
jgi:beta-RFAP synthase